MRNGHWYGSKTVYTRISILDFRNSRKKVDMSKLKSSILTFVVGALTLLGAAQRAEATSYSIWKPIHDSANPQALLFSGNGNQPGVFLTKTGAANDVRFMGNTFGTATTTANTLYYDNFTNGVLSGESPTPVAGSQKQFGPTGTVAGAPAFTSWFSNTGNNLNRAAAWVDLSGQIKMMYNPGATGIWTAVFNVGNPVTSPALNTNNIAMAETGNYLYVFSTTSNGHAQFVRAAVDGNTTQPSFPGAWTALPFFTVLGTNGAPNVLAAAASSYGKIVIGGQIGTSTDFYTAVITVSSGAVAGPYVTQYMQIEDGTQANMVAQGPTGNSKTGSATGIMVTKLGIDHQVNYGTSTNGITFTWNVYNPTPINGSTGCKWGTGNSISARGVAISWLSGTAAPYTYALGANCSDVAGASSDAAKYGILTP
jgi:hypothetical protein